MIHYLNTFTQDPQEEISMVTVDPVQVGTPVQVAIDKKGKPVMKPVREILLQRDSPGYSKINPQYYDVII